MKKRCRGSVQDDDHINETITTQITTRKRSTLFRIDDLIHLMDIATPKSKRWDGLSTSFKEDVVILVLLPLYHYFHFDIVYLIWNLFDQSPWESVFLSRSFSVCGDAELQTDRIFCLGNQLLSYQLRNDGIHQEKMLNLYLLASVQETEEKTTGIIKEMNDDDDKKPKEETKQETLTDKKGKNKTYMFTDEDCTQQKDYKNKIDILPYHIATAKFTTNKHSMFFVTDNHQLVYQNFTNSLHFGNSEVHVFDYKPIQYENYPMIQPNYFPKIQTEKTLFGFSFSFPIHAPEYFYPMFALKHVVLNKWKSKILELIETELVNPCMDNGKSFLSGMETSTKMIYKILYSDEDYQPRFITSIFPLKHKSNRFISIIQACSPTENVVMNKKSLGKEEVDYDEDEEEEDNKEQSVEQSVEEQSVEQSVEEQSINEFIFQKWNEKWLETFSYFEQCLEPPSDEDEEFLDWPIFIDFNPAMDEKQLHCIKSTNGLIKDVSILDNRFIILVTESDLTVYNYRDKFNYESSHIHLMIYEIQYDLGCNYNEKSDDKSRENTGKNTGKNTDKRKIIKEDYIFKTNNLPNYKTQLRPTSQRSNYYFTDEYGNQSLFHKHASQKLSWFLQLEDFIIFYEEGYNKNLTRFCFIHWINPKTKYHFICKSFTSMITMITSRKNEKECCFIFFPTFFQIWSIQNGKPYCNGVVDISHYLKSETSEKYYLKDVFMFANGAIALVLRKVGHDQIFIKIIKF